MKSTLPKLLAAAVGVAPLLSLPVLGGCSSHYHERVVAYPDRDVYVSEPGYYYDREYYDPGGRFHDRRFYYYDGHRWSDRDAVPSGFTARERHERHEEHREHQVHHDHDVD